MTSKPKLDLNDTKSRQAFLLAGRVETSDPEVLTHALWDWKVLTGTALACDVEGLRIEHRFGNALSSLSDWAHRIIQFREILERPHKANVTYEDDCVGLHWESLHLDSVTFHVVIYRDRVTVEWRFHPHFREVSVEHYLLYEVACGI